jgi:hypothetical protein
VLVGVVVGIFPLIWYNLHAEPGFDSISVFNAMHTTDASLHLPFSHQVIGTFLISLPLIIGVNPICSVDSSYKITFTSAHPGRCTAIYGTWSVSFLLLCAAAFLIAAVAFWRIWKLRTPGKFRAWFEENRPELVRLLARFALLGNVVLMILSYVDSPNSAHLPALNYRYLIGMLISFPVVLSPLLPVASRLNKMRWPDMVRVAALGLITLLLIAGTVQVFEDIPNAQAAYQQQTNLTNDLEKLGIKHVYSEYWTCAVITLIAQDHLICATVDINLQNIANRYKAYWPMVHNDPKASYAFPVDSGFSTNVEQYLRLHNIPYRHLVLDGYDIYLLS